MSALVNLTAVSREVSTEAGQLMILDDISVAIQQGESVAIQGASGSGKSTLLGVMAGLDVPTAGSVMIDGTDIVTLNEDQRATLRANQVGFVFQSFHLINELTALENVALPLELFGHKNADCLAAEWLAKLGLADRRDHRPTQLSGGEQQRVALCRAFAVQPKLLFADEPTANLDANTASTVLNHLFRLQREQHSTLVIATHDPTLAQRCDRQLIMQGGRLQEAN